MPLQRHRSIVLALAVACGLAAATSAEVVDQVVANVDKEVILLSDIMMELGPQIRDIRTQSANEQEFRAAMDRQIRATLEQAIENRILLREAQLAGLEVEDAAVEKRLEDYKKLYPSNEEFMRELEAAGETLTELRSRLKKQMLARGMAVRKMKELESGIVISESDVAQFYQDNKSSFEHPERVRCAQIFLPATTAQERDTVRARLEQLREEVIDGADFADLAIEHSQAPGAQDGGLIGWVVRGDLVAPLDDAVFSLNEGEISEVIETPQGFHLLKVEKKEGSGLATLDEARREIEPKLRAAGAAEKYKKWMADLRKRSRVQIFI